MTSKYKKSKRADGDIAHITEKSLKDFGILQTIKYMDGLEECLEFLAEDPGRGKPFTHSATYKAYFRHRYISHVIYYRKRKHDIFIVRVLHRRMLPENHL